MYFSGREEFYWGVSAHNHEWKAYPAEKLEDQIRAAAEMNVNLYRVDIKPDSKKFGFDYLDKTVELCEKYNLDMMFIIYRAEGFALETAKRYKGRVKFYQMRNEQDLAAHKKGDGLQISDYDEERLTEVTLRLKSISAELRQGDASARLVINATWWHTGFIDYILEQDVDFDIIGWDWYSNMDKAKYDNESKISTLSAIIDKLCEYGKDIIFCEVNIWNKPENGDPQQKRSAYLLKAMTTVYRHPSALLKGFVIYELLDEPCHRAESERIFGMLECDEAGNIGKPKDAYYTVQHLLEAN